VQLPATNSRRSCLRAAVARNGVGMLQRRRQHCKLQIYVFSRSPDSRDRDRGSLPEVPGAYCPRPRVNLYNWLAVDVLLVANAARWIDHGLVVDCTNRPAAAHRIEPSGVCYHRKLQTACTVMLGTARHAQPDQEHTAQFDVLLVTVRHCVKVLWNSRAWFDGNQDIAERT
jgi:hypothetical protein